MALPQGVPRTTGLAVGALAALALAAPAASAALSGTLAHDLVGLEEMRVEARLNATGDLADRLREQTDDDGDGRVEGHEVAGAQVLLGRRLEGPTSGYALDGNAYAVEDADVDLAGLEGPADATGPVRLELAIEATVEPGPGPEHVWRVREPLADLAPGARVALELRAPGGHALADARAFEIRSECRARAPPGPANASAQLEPREDACPRPLPAPGWLGLAAALAAAAGIRRA